MKLKTGKLTPSHAVAICGLAGLFYLVMPGGRTADKSTTDVEQASDSQPASAAPEPVAPAETIDQSQPVQKPAATELISAVKPLPDVGEAELMAIISANPFYVAAEVIPVELPPEIPQMPEVSIVAPVPAGPSRMEEIVGSSKLNLIYSSSRGTRAAILNDEVVRSGGKTNSGLTVMSIRSDGIEVSLIEEAQTQNLVPSP